MKDISQAYGNLTLDNNGNSGASTPLNSTADNLAFDTVTVRSSGIISSSLATLPLNATTLTGNGTINVVANSLALWASNISMQGGNITSSSGALNITLPASINASNFNVTVSTTSGTIRIFYGASGADRCDVSGAIISGTPNYYYAPWSNTTVYRCVRAVILDTPAIMDSANSTRTIFNTNESFYPYIRIREYNGTDYFDVAGSWTMDTYNSNGSVPNATGISLTNASGSYSWRTAQKYNESRALNGYSFLANVSGTTGHLMTNISLGNLYNYYTKQLNITYTINDSAIYATESSLINGTVYREPEHAASTSAPVNITVNLGTTNVGGRITDGSGNYNFTYTPAAVSSITTVTLTLNATDTDGINGTTTNSSAIKVYPAINTTASKAWTDKQYYNKGENITFAALLYANNGGVLQNAVARAYNSNFSTSYIGISERNQTFWNGTYEGNYTTLAGDNYGNWTIDSRTEANWGTPLSSVSAYINPFSINSGAYSDITLFNARSNFTQSEMAYIKVENLGSSTMNATVTIYDSMGTGVSAQNVSVPATGITQVSYQLADGSIGVDKQYNAGFWNAVINATNGTQVSYRAIGFYVIPDWWVENTLSSNYWEYRVRVILDNSRGIARNNVSVQINGSQLNASGANLSTLNVGSIRIVDAETNGTGANEANGRSIPYYTNASGALNPGDVISFSANISENSKKAYYVYYSATSMAPPSYASVSGPYFPASPDQREDSNLKIYGLVTNKGIYRFGETIYMNASIFSKNPGTTTANFFIYNNTGQEVNGAPPCNLRKTGVTDPNADRVYEASKVLDSSCGSFGNWRVYVTADDGAGSTDSRSLNFTVDQLNIPFTVSNTVFDAGTTITISGNVSRASNGAVADNANVSISRDSTIIYNNVTGSNGNFSYTYVENIPGAHTMTVNSNKTISGSIITGQNSTPITVNSKADVYIQSLDTNRDLNDNPTFLVNVTNNYANVSETINFDFQVNDTNGPTGYTIPRATIIVPALGSNSTTIDWDIKNVAPQNYTIGVKENITTWVAGGYIAGQNSTWFNRLNMTEALSAYAVNTFDNIIVNGTVQYGPNGAVLNNEIVNITISGPENYTYQVNSNPSNYNYTFSVGTHGNYTVSVVSAGVQYKGYNTTNFTVNYTANLTIALNTSTIKANQVLGINVTTKNNDNASVSGLSTNITLLDGGGAPLWSLLNVSQNYNALQNITNTTSWATTTTAPGTYYIRARAYLGGQQAGDTNQSFQINETRNITESISANASSYGMNGYASISAWVNRTGNVLINGTADIYLISYNGTRYEAELNNSGTWTTDNITYTSLLSQNIQARWNTQNFHNGTYYPYLEFNYTDEYGNNRSIKTNSTITINPTWSATLVYKFPTKLQYNWTDTFANVTVIINNTGNTEICDEADECEIYIQSAANSSPETHLFTTTSSGHATGWTVVGGSANPVNISTPQEFTAYKVNFQFNQAPVWSADNHTFNMTFHYDGARTLDNQTLKIEVLPVLGNITLEDLTAASNVWYNHFQANTNILFDAKWRQAGGNMNFTVNERLNLTKDPDPAPFRTLQQQISLPPSGTFTNYNILWNTGQQAPGTYYVYYYMIRLDGTPISFVKNSDSTTLQYYSATFYIDATNDTRITSLAVDKSSNYSMNENVTINGSIWRFGNADFTGNLNINITGPAGAFSLGSCNRAVNINSSVNASFTCAWNTSNYAPGIYNVSAAVLWGASNMTINWTLFNITTVKAAQVSVDSDKGSYNMNDNLLSNINITGSGNSNVTGNLTLSLIGPETKTLYSENNIQVSTATGANRSIAWNIANTLAGNYTLNATYQYTDGNALQTTSWAQKNITIAQTRGAAAGISANKSTYADHEGVNITFNITTAGNVIYPSLNYNITINNSVGTLVSSSWASVGRNTTLQSSAIWNTGAWPNGDYNVLLTVSDLSSGTIWTANTVFTISMIKRASITGISTDRVPPNYYNLGDDVWISGGTVNADGNANFTGNLTIQFVKQSTGSVYNTTTCNNFATSANINTCVSKISIPSPAWSVGRVIVNASFAYYNGTQNAVAINQTTFQIGTTSVTIWTTDSNSNPKSTYFKNDMVNVHVLLQNTSGGNVTGVAAGNITSATLSGSSVLGSISGWTPVAGKPGEYSFNIGTRPLGTYTLVLVMQDPFEGSSGTSNTIAFSVSEHWLVATMDSTGISPVVSIARGYVAANLGSLNAIAIIYKGATFDSVSGVPNSMTLDQKLEGNNAYLVFTQGTWQKINDRMPDVLSGTFDNYISPTFGFPLSDINRVTVSLEYSDKGINTTGNVKLAPGMYTFVIKNEGTQNGKTIISIGRKS
ncbi:Uncharacterised protein [uncultured archaeon]|nr:Uncharacterised protein [uncultured archaeon]